jgi:hypothetical protein
MTITGTLYVPLNINAPDNSKFIQNYHDMSVLNNDTIIKKETQDAINADHVDFVIKTEALADANANLYTAAEQLNTTIEDGKQRPNKNTFIKVNNDTASSNFSTSCFSNPNALFGNNTNELFGTVPITKSKCAQDMLQKGENKYIFKTTDDPQKGVCYSFKDTFTPTPIREFWV